MRINKNILRKKPLSIIIPVAAFLLTVAIASVAAAALDGVGGYDGSGISSGGGAGRAAYDFQEYVFFTGEPVLLKGTMYITKSENSDTVISVYSFNLSNIARNIQLTRDISYTTVSYAKEGGQTVTVTSLTREPAEKIVFNAQTYTLRHMDFTRSSLVDEKPAVKYYTGNTWYRKQYEVGGGAATSASGNILTLEATGGFYGFDQAWGCADIEETQFVLDYTQSAATTSDGAVRELWSGTTEVRRSQSTVTELRYVENEPDAISFRGGYLETRYNNNVLEFSARLPEMDSLGYATGRLKNYTDSTQISTFPSVKRLVSPNLSQIRGHWAEESVSKLFGLEILTTRPSEYSPDQYITRAKFAAALVAAAKPVPEETAAKKKNTPKTGKKAAEPKPSFTDVPAGHEYFTQIEEAFNRGMMKPVDKNEFRPNQKMIVADAAIVFIRALGLEAVASAHGAITEYSDDTGIPAYARDALYVCQKIGLLRGDDRGNIYPMKELTEAEAAVMIDRLVEYMRKDLKADYRDNIMDY